MLSTVRFTINLTSLIENILILAVNAMGVDFKGISLKNAQNGKSLCNGTCLKLNGEIDKKRNLN
jgi:hypothetical protein